VRNTAFLFLQEFLTRFQFYLTIILAPEFERAFDKANYRVLICLALYR